MLKIEHTLLSWCSYVFTSATISEVISFITTIQIAVNASTESGGLPSLECCISEQTQRADAKKLTRLSILNLGSRNPRTDSS